jgi:hypothetical protein
MSEARQGICARQGMAGLLHEARQRGCAKQGRADARGKVV